MQALKVKLLSSMSKNLDDSNPDVVKCRDAARALAEHFDSVQIFATRHEAGELASTLNVDVGVGNWFARYGQVASWLAKADEGERETVRNQEPED